MKITVEATDIRDDKKYYATVESWETLETVRSIPSYSGILEYVTRCCSQLQEKVPNATTTNQQFYVQDEFINPTIPADQLRKKSRAAGMLDDNEDEGEPKLARCFLYISPTPLDFGNMMLDDLIQKLRGKRKGEVKQIIFRMQVAGSENKFCINVDSASVTGKEIQPLFGTRIKIDIDGYLMHEPVILRIAVKKCMGLATIEKYDISMLDHLVVADLKGRVCSAMKSSSNAAVAQAPVNPHNIRLKINGYSVYKNGVKRLVKKFGIPPDELWLRAFKVKNYSPVNVYI
ncbi:hypothetical protein cyc_01900 [Cyclospora cayetanensis]|uniref:Uncharacterized protein n=1 Tax=Cyclospora cayetanensis TaxID=88456 RepID=A0A1D3CSR4_9EIME|nr:hypothetical protein cyc_01900 [Cyclospora cayetanensis]